MLLDSDVDGRPNPIKARGLFLKAAARGSPEGQNNLGFCFQTGTGERGEGEGGGGGKGKAGGRGGNKGFVKFFY